MRARRVPKQNKGAHKEGAEKATGKCSFSLYYGVLAVALRIQFKTLQVSMCLFRPSTHINLNLLSMYYIQGTEGSAKM